MKLFHPYVYINPSLPPLSFKNVIILSSLIESYSVRSYKDYHQLGITTRKIGPKIHCDDLMDPLWSSHLIEAMHVNILVMQSKEQVPIHYSGRPSLEEILIELNKHYRISQDSSKRQHKLIE